MCRPGPGFYGTRRRAGLICPSWTRGRGSRVRRPAGACHPFNHRKRDGMTIVEARPVTGGVDTHADTHVAAALDSIGGLPGVQEFPVTPAGYARLLGWLGGSGTVALAGIEGTGRYGAGLARHITAAGPAPRRAEGPRRRGGGDPGPDGRQAQRPLGADPDDQPGQVPDRDRPG